MSKETKAGHISDRMYRWVFAEVRANAVEQRSRFYHLGICFSREPALFDRGRVDTDSEGFRKNEYITYPRAGILPQLLDAADTDDCKAVYRLRRVNRVPPCHWDVGRCANCAA